MALCANMGSRSLSSYYMNPTTQNVQLNLSCGINHPSSNILMGFNSGPTIEHHLSGGSDDVGASTYFVELPFEEKNNEGKALALALKPSLPLSLINQFKSVNLKRVVEGSLSSRCSKRTKVGGGSVNNGCSDLERVSDCTSPPQFKIGINKNGRKVVRKKKGKGVACMKLDVGTLVEDPVLLGEVQNYFDDLSSHTSLP